VTTETKEIIKSAPLEQFNTKLKTIQEQAIADRVVGNLEFYERNILQIYLDFSYHWFLIPQEKLVEFSDADHEILFRLIAKKALWRATFWWCILLPIPLAGWFALFVVCSDWEGSLSLRWSFYRLKRWCGKNYFPTAEAVKKFLK